MNPIRPFAARCLLIAGSLWIAHSGRGLAGQPIDPDVDALMRDLSADSYATRQRAEQRLWTLTADQQTFDDVIERLRIDLRMTGAAPPRDDLEGYLAKRRLHHRLEQRRAEGELDRFIHDPTFHREFLPGWQVFRRYAGDDVTSRLLFAELTRRNLTGPFAEGVTNALAEPPRQLDAIRRDDCALWSLVLIAACRRSSTSPSAFSLELTSILRCEGTGPMPRREAEQKVLARLVEHFIACPKVDARDRVVIGLRYGCRLATLQQCRSILNDGGESPSRIVTALLAASVLDASGSEIDAWIQRYRGDDRVSHTWRSMVPPKTTRRTQVRDVALAIELHRLGIDPRTRGFDALIADPLLVYRPYSLGFENESARRRAHGDR